MSNCAMDYLDLETGGDLFGFWTHSGNPVIQYVIGPGPSARRSKGAFYQDYDYLLETGKLLQKIHGLQHIGEWHSHHGLNMSVPSIGDLNTIKKAICKYKLNNFLVIICNFKKNGKRTKNHKIITNINGFILSSGKLNTYKNCKWAVLWGESPMRHNLRKKKVLNYQSIKIENKKIIYVAEPKTTLDENVINVSKKAFFPEYSWLNGIKGKQSLKAFVDKLSREINSKIKIMQDEERRIYLDFCYAKNPIKVIFPHNFPYSRLIIQYKLDGEENRIPDIYDKLTNNEWDIFNLICEEIFNKNKTQTRTELNYVRY